MFEKYHQRISGEWLKIDAYLRSMTGAEIPVTLLFVDIRGFTAIALGSLALGIGANTAIFSLINDLFLRSLSFKEPRRVVHFLSNAPDRKLVDLPLSLPRFQHYRAGQTICEDLAAENVFAFTLTGLGDAVQLFGGRVTSNYFDVLGVQPILGRTFVPDDDRRNFPLHAV